MTVVPVSSPSASSTAVQFEGAAVSQRVGGLLSFTLVAVVAGVLMI